MDFQTRSLEIARQLFSNHNFSTKMGVAVPLAFVANDSNDVTLNPDALKHFEDKPQHLRQVVQEIIKNEVRSLLLLSAPKDLAFCDLDRDKWIVLKGTVYYTTLEGISEFLQKAA